MKQLILFISIILLNTNCKKEYKGETTVYGYVYTKGTTDYPGDSATELGIQYYSPGGITSGGSWGYVDKIMTDDQGYYSYTFNTEEAMDYRVVANKEFKLHWFPYTYSGKHIISGKNQQIDLEIAPHAYLKLHVRNKIDPKIGDEL